MSDQTAELKELVQQIIDAVAAKQLQLAVEKHADASDLIDDLIDHAEDDDLLVELSKYQILLNHLHQKIYNGE